MTSVHPQADLSEPEPELEAGYEYPDLTPDFYADTNDMYLGYQQAETEPDLDRFAAPVPEPEAEL